MDKNIVNGFGTFKGVFIPSILTILGVIMYLRLGWVVGTVGPIGTIVIVTISSAITFLTGLSIAATATNMKVKGGGAYYMVSRSFGLEAGAAIGFPLFLAQATGISFYISGFSESLAVFFPGVPMPLIGLGALAVIGFLAYKSADLALRSQYVIFAIIILSLISLFLGKPVEPSGVTMLQVSPEWLGARLYIFCLAEDPQEKAGLETSKLTFIHQSRLEASVKVILRKNKSLSEHILENSSYADVVFLGLCVHEKIKSEEIQKLARQLRLDLESLPMLVLTLKGETVSHKQIFA